MALKRWSYFPLKPQNSPQHPCPVHSAEASPHHSCHNFLAVLQTFSAYLYPTRPGTITHRPLSRFVPFARSLYLVSTVKAVKQLMSAILAMLLVVKTLENVPFICQKIHEIHQTIIFTQTIKILIRKISDENLSIAVESLSPKPQRSILCLLGVAFVRGDDLFYSQGKINSLSSKTKLEDAWWCYKKLFSQKACIFAFYQIVYWGPGYQL